MQKGLYFTAVGFSFFRRLICEVTEQISTKFGHIFTYDCYLKNLVWSSPGVYSSRAGGKNAFWDRLRNLTENIYSIEHDINNRKETHQSTGTPLHTPNLVNVGLQTAEHGWGVLPTPSSLCAGRAKGSHLRHISVYSYSPDGAYWSTQLPRAWLALVKLRAGRVYAGLCHAPSSILFKYYDKSKPVNFAQYDIMPYNIEIVSWP